MLLTLGAAESAASRSALRAGMLCVQHQQPVHGVLGPLGVPIYAILGNHDYGDPQLRHGELWTCGPIEPQADPDMSGLSF